MTDWGIEVRRLLRFGRDREAALVAVHHLSSSPASKGNVMGPLEQFEQLAPALGRVVGGIDAAQLDAPTPCAEFTVRGVLEHMIGGATNFAAGFRGEQAPAVDEVGDDSDGDGDGDKVFARFESALGELAAAVQSPGALERTIQAPFGAMPGDEFARFVVLDGLVHGWDMAWATGQEYAPPEALVQQAEAFARDAITDDMRKVGMFGPAADAPTHATPIERLAAFTGRQVNGGTR